MSMCLLRAVRLLDATANLRSAFVPVTAYLQK